MIRIVLLGNPSFLDESTGALRGRPDLRVAGATHDPAEAVGLVADLGPEAVIVDHDLAAGGMEAGSQLARRNPGVMVFLATDRPGYDLVRRAMSAGMRNILPKPLDPSQVVKMVLEARSDEARRAAGFDRNRDLERKEVSSAIRDSSPVVARQEIIVFYSPKGGVGKTTVAVNLAAAYLGKLRPVVVDFDVFGNVAGMLQIQSSISVSDWAGVAGETIDRRALDSLVVKHPSGLAVVPGIRKFGDSELLTAEIAQTIISSLRKYYDIIVVDAGPQIRDSALVAFDHATKIFMMATLDIATLRSVNEMSETFELLGVDDSKVRLLLNRVGKKPDISMREVTDLMNFTYTGKLPEDPNVQVLANRGEIMTLARPESPFSAEVRKLAGGIVPVSARKRGIFARLFGGGNKPKRRHAGFESDYDG